MAHNSDAKSFIVFENNVDFRQRFFRNGIMIVDIEWRLQRGEQPKISGFPSSLLCLLHVQTDSRDSRNIFVVNRPPAYPPVPPFSYIPCFCISCVRRA